MRKRTLARELALQFLYMLDLRQGEGTELFEEFVQEATKSKEVADYARRLVEGVRAELPELDRRISEVAKNWQLGRMAVVDRNVLRLGAYEILRCEDIPPKVAINEAIDLGKKYSTEHSGAFINGILDKIRAEARA